MWGIAWIELAQDRERWWAVVNAVMNFLTSYEPVSFSRTLLHGLRSMGFER
jgi:hypothetical protein